MEIQTVYFSHFFGNNACELEPKNKRDCMTFVTLFRTLLSLRIVFFYTFTFEFPGIHFDSSVFFSSSYLSLIVLAQFISRDDFIWVISF